MDGIVYATRAGLGFALVENVMYLLGSGSYLAFIGMFFARALLAVPMHAISAAVMGYFAGRKRFDGTGIGLFGGFILAVLIHGIYDAGIFSAMVAHDMGHQSLVTLGYATPIVVVIIGAITVKKLATRAVAADDAAEAALATAEEQ